jgi:hypothetical protein
MRGLSGNFFENLGHLYFQKRIYIAYAPMARLSRDYGTNKPQWHSSHPILNENNSELTRLRQTAWKDRRLLNTRPADTYEYGDQEFREIDPMPNIYYIPKMANEEALDSFILHDNLLFIFQFTVSKKHDIKTGFISRFTAFNKFPPFEDWRFIFIIPYKNDQIFKNPYVDFPNIRGFKPSSAQVAIPGYAELIESTEPHPQRPIEEGEESAHPKKIKLGIAEGPNDGGTRRGTRKGRGRGKGS